MQNDNRYDTNNENGYNSSLRIGYFIAGVGIGAIAGVLFAPKSGEESRGDMTRKVRELRTRAEDLVETAREFPDRVNQAVDAGREAYQRAKSEIQ